MVPETKGITMEYTKTIALTGKAPVKIRMADWPIIAHGRREDFDGHHRHQANQASNLDIVVRQHFDGRSLVYGVYAYESNFERSLGSLHRAGYVIEVGGDIAAAIQRVGADLIARGVNVVTARDVVDECIANLPAQEL
jgi:hypothetical protein